MTTRILVFDNYDSFTYNLVHLVEKLLHTKVDVCLNDSISLEAVSRYDKIILSPGPGIPEEAGILIPLIQEYAAIKSILGVCLGQQAIARAFGGSIINLSDVFHGVASPVFPIYENNRLKSKLFNGLPDPFIAGRYHSWVVNEADLPTELHITARDENDLIMGLQHSDFDIQAVQFHPESVLTPQGERLLGNWLFS